MKRLLPAVLVLALPVSALATSDTTPEASPGSVVHSVGEAPGAMHGMAAADMEQMARDMGIEITGDPDTDFARSMIVHHEGAIAMAEVLLENGKDPELRAMAEDVIEAQQGEIKFLEDWLTRNGE